MKRLLVALVLLAAWSGVALAQPVPVTWRPPTTCSSGQALVWNGSAWVCGSGGITNSAGANVLMKSDGTNAVASLWTDDGTTTAYNTNKFTIASASGNTAIAGTLGVTGLATLTGGFTLGADSSAASHKITNLTNGSSAQDAAAFGQIASGVNAAVSGTSGRSARFTGTNAVGNGAFTDDGTNVSIAGTIAVNTSGDSALISTKKAASTDGLNLCIGGGCQSVAYDGANSYSGSTNTALGFSALNALTTGYENTAVGRYALNANTTGFSNTAIGMTAGLAMTSGAYNTCIGAQSCLALTTANDNTVVGQLAYAAQTTGGNGNTIMGVQAMQNSTGVNAKQNVAIGLNAYLNGTAQNNVIIGYQSDYLASTANSSVIIGAFASNAHTTGNQNTLIGEQVGQDLTTGGTNTFLGRRTGYGITTGSNNTIVGANVTGLSAALSNNVILADGAGVVRFQADSSGNTSVGASGATLTVTGNTNVSAGIATLGQTKGTVQTTSSTGTQNDFVVNATTTFLRWTGSGANVTYTGFKCGASDCAAGDDGRILVVICNGTAGGNSCTLSRDSASSTAANRIYTLDGSHSVALLSTNSSTTAAATLIYDGTALRWRVLQMWSTRHDENFEFVNTVVADSGMSVGSPGLTTIGNGNIMIASGGIGHMLNKQSAITPSSCGTGPTGKATDVGGHVTTGTGATGCVITFGTGYTTDVPACVVTFEAGATGSYTVSTTAITITTGASVTFDYWCSGFTG